MVTATRTTVVGVFANQLQAQQCVQELKRLGFDDDQIGVAARGESNTIADTNVAEDTEAGSGALTGAVAGAGVGGLWALGIMAGVLPVIGPAIAGGVLASILSSAAAAAAVGGVAGALIGLGIPEDEADTYEKEFHAGRTIVTVRGESRLDEAISVMRKNGGSVQGTDNVHAASLSMKSMPERVANRMQSPTAAPAASCAPASSCAPATSCSSTTGERTIELHEEQLHATKQPVQTGQVNVRKEVVTEVKHIDVPVTREEVVIERRQVGGRAASASDIGTKTEEIRIPVSEERVTVSKDTIVKEEVHIGKRKVMGTESVEGTVRHEELKVDETGNAKAKRK